MFIHLIIYLSAFIGIWIGAGITISSVEKLSKTLHISAFATAFLILGFFTSLSELSVGINAVIENDREIFVGNLIGASAVIFMLVIPLLSITGRQVLIHPVMRGNKLLLSLIVISLPTLLSIDGKVTQIDASIVITSYLLLLFSIHLKKTTREVLQTKLSKPTKAMMHQFAKIVAGVATIFASSHFIVQETMYFAQLIKVTPFLISLLIVSIGTNIPELSFVVQSFFSKSNQVAFGDYVGSATFNSFLFGGLTLFYGKTIVLTNSYLISLLFLISALVAFYIFAQSKNAISRREGLVLLSIYIAFLMTEIFFH